MGRFAGFSMQAASAGLLAALVGFASSFAVVLQGLDAIGASRAEAASGLMALSLAMGLCGVFLSLKTKLPVSIAWSTPGAALLATTGPLAGGFAAAVGAFMICGVLIVLSGLWKPLGRWVAAIPASLANAMLAGVLLTFCLAPVQAVAEGPELALPIILAWALVWRFKRLYAVPAALVVTIAVIVLTNDLPPFESAYLIPRPVLVIPEFSLAALIGIALPLFIVTMASQNIPGVAVLNANGYRPTPGPLFAATGLFSLLAAPFGGHAVNLAAITAALCAGPDAHPDPQRRYWAALVSGAFYVLFGLMAAAIAAFVLALPTYLIMAVAGLALLGPFAAALTDALGEAEDRLPAVVTFVVTASGLSFLGVGSAFWGLLAGLALYALTRWRGRL
ncbi:benzoate/H(+) symporter BenE family transporter [Pelagibius litoralis]|uniref:Benzoate/H(+) symporter BenE family transporter n=1 Tax=Pelagibius litoralis TaxID=374515 RepID=A0A967EXD9_9PROT|nr:benzoate/H(+) symporter BenE family transporter [Pelagibius litoralis]NIA69050.1 benzoate/H(+) symporter BenE family transporter [Pelagibius litoralis]